MKKGLVLWLLLGSTFLPEGLAQSQRQRWVATYWCNWNQSPANFQELLGQNAFTHVIHFAIGLNANGTFFEDPNFHDLTVQSVQMIPAAHAVGVKVVICCFPGSLQTMQSAMSSGTRATTIHNLMNIIRTYGYDGIDWDIEVGYDDATWPGFQALLRDSLNVVGAAIGRPLTNSVWTYGNGWTTANRLAWRYFDRIHIAGYEQTGAWQGWIVWNGYGINTGGYHLPCYPAISVAGVDSVWAGWLRLGVPDSVLLFSQSCSGRTWTGGTIVANILGYPANGTNGALRPGDVWTGSWPPDCGSYNGMPVVSGYEYPYTDIVNGPMSAYPTLHDTIAMAAYKSVDNPGSANDTYLPFPDPWTWWQDWYYVAHVRNGGGMSMWDAWRGRVASNNFPLIDALKLSIANIPLPSAPTGTFTITPDTLPAGGGQVTLAWTSQNATSATLSPAIGSVALNGSMNLNVSSSMTFTFTAANSVAQVQYTARVGVASSGGGTYNTVTDNFNRASNTSLGLGWAVPSGRVSCGITVNQCNGQNGRGFNYRTENFGNNQYAEVTPKAVMVGYRYVYAGVRMGGANGEGYYVKTDGTNTSLVKISSTGSETVLQTLTNVNFTEYGSDRMKIQVVANVLKVFKNGIQVNVDLIDNSITSGHPGVSVTPDNNCTLDDFEGGELLVGGQGQQDITAQATSIIALVTQPTGRGNPDIAVVRDGFTPPVGSSDTSRQYATYNGGGPRATDWIGYQFASQHTFSSMVFQEGMQFTDGGWVATLNVQVRVSGTWTIVQNLRCTPSYAGANGVNYETYELWFTPIAGDAIRISGAPGGSAAYMTVGELRVFDTAPVPMAPQLATPGNGATGISRSPTLTWTASNGATSYRVQVSTDAAFVTAAVDQSNIVSTSYSVSGLAEGTTYFWHVNATSLGGTSAFSQAWSFATASVPLAPVLLSPPDAASNLSVPVPLSWRRSSGSTSYHLQLATDSMCNALIINDSTVVDSTRQASGLSFQTRYFWRVRGRNSNGNGSFSPVRKFTTVGGLPGVPLLQSPTNESTNRSTSILLRWHTSVGATSYQLQVSTDSLFSLMILNDSTIVDSSRQLRSLAGLTKYFWRVRGKNVAGRSAFSPIWRFTTRKARKNITSNGVVTSLVGHPVGNGNPNPEIIRDGISPLVGSSNPMDQFDTYSGSLKQFDWIGYTFAETHEFSNLEFQEGIESDSGGWFDALGVQVRVNGAWINVQNLTSGPTYAPNNNADFESYELDFDPIVGDGIRIAGTPGGTRTYVSVAELVAMDDDTAATPTKRLDGIAGVYKLDQNYPNPFNPSTKITFTLTVPSVVTLEVLNMLGQQVATLVNGTNGSGTFEIVWNGRDSFGRAVSSGVYVYRLFGVAGKQAFSQMRKMLLVK